MLHCKIETRTWSTKYRGLVLICASAKPYKWDEIMAITGEKQFYRIIETLHDVKRQLTGEAIAIGRLVDCRPMTMADEDNCFVEFHPELYCHIYQDVRQIYPFQWKGCQGWKAVDPELIKSIQYL